MTAWSDGDRVTHPGWGCTGTVGRDTDQRQVVAWDGSCVTDELDRIADHLQHAH